MSRVEQEILDELAREEAEAALNELVADQDYILATKVG